MADKPKPGSAEWQAALNAEIAEHDAKQTGEQFETGGAKEQAERGDQAAGK